MDRLLHPPVHATRLMSAVAVVAVALTAAPAAAAAPRPATPAAETVSTPGPAAALLVRDSVAAAVQRTHEPAPAAAVVPGPSLERGQTLHPGEALVSPSGQYSLVVDEDGDVLLQKSANSLAAAYATILLHGGAGARLVMQHDGNVVVYGPDGTVFDHLGTGGTAGSSLRVQDDGNVVLYGATGAVVHNLDTAEPEVLFGGGTLLPGERLVSEDGGTVLVMQQDGNLVLYTHGTARWATGTSTPGSGYVVQQDGNAVVYAPSGRPLWATGTSRRSELDAVLVTDREFRVVEVQGDVEQGDVEVFSAFGSSWPSNVVEPGMQLLRGDRRAVYGGGMIVFQRDGNLVQFQDGYQTGFTSRTSADLALMQPDGNFVLYAFDGAGRAVPAWHTRTAGHPGSRLVLQQDRNLVVYTPSNRPVYASITW